MSTISRLRGAALSVEMSHDLVERLLLSIDTADSALRSVHRTAPIETALERIARARDLCSQICSTLPDSAPLFQEAELAQQIEQTEHNRRTEPCPA